MAELVFIPSLFTGHLVSAVEIAKLLVDRDHRLSITILLMRRQLDFKISSYTISKPRQRLKFVNLPPDESTVGLLSNNGKELSRFVDWNKNHVRNAVSEMIANFSELTRLAGFVIDMLCTPMIDVANEFGVPTYVYFTSSAAFLGLMLHLQTLHGDHNQDVTEFKDSDELVVPTFVNPLPAKVLPTAVLDKEGGSTFLLTMAKKFREAKGIMVNTFEELEFHAVKSLSDEDKIPPIYPVGPLLNLEDESNDNRNHQSKAIMRWLDNQAPSSVVFLCFGSMGSFDEEQVKEIAVALEQSGHQFLWSLRRPPSNGKRESPGEYENPKEVLPEGFLERTTKIGKVIGWAPQVAVLSHLAVGCFVSHCGWNSTLESFWCGVPMATWPMYAEQQLNAFQLVKEFGVAVEIKMESNVIVTAAEIEGGIKRLMDDDTSTEIRKKVKEIREKSKTAVAEGGSSYNSVGCFIEDVMNNPQ
ncbi:hydroquinone glucosyltransferase [Sarracenia purpurea var. burkii]